MIELKHDTLEFSFPEIGEELEGFVKKQADSVLVSILGEDRKKVFDSRYGNWSWVRPLRRGLVKKLKNIDAAEIKSALLDSMKARIPSVSVGINFQRTLRLPDDGNTYPLPPGLGRFPLRHVDDFEGSVPNHWFERGGVLMPMYQAEALWLHFRKGYPCAIKVGAGKINAVTGEAWSSALGGDEQDYMVVPGQPWLDGFAVAKGAIRQFVAMPLGKGYSAEEQITENAEWGGLQVQVYPMKAEEYFETQLKPKLPSRLEELLPKLLPELSTGDGCIYKKALRNQLMELDLGLAPGGRMQQEIYEDPHGVDCWDQETTSRCFVHLCNALDWRAITGANPPQPPVTVKEYERAGLPWFDYYRDDLDVLEGSKTLAGLKSIAEKDKEVFGSTGFDEPLAVKLKVVSCSAKKRPGVVREW